MAPPWSVRGGSVKLGTTLAGVACLPFFSFVLEPAPLCEDSPSHSCTDCGGAQHSQTTRPPLAHSSLSCLLCPLRACPEHHGAWEPDWDKLTRLAPHGTTVEGAQLHLIFASCLCDGVNVEAIAPSQHSTYCGGLPAVLCCDCASCAVPPSHPSVNTEQQRPAGKFNAREAGMKGDLQKLLPRALTMPWVRSLCWR